jgi:hypothetical protein
MGQSLEGKMSSHPFRWFSRLVVIGGLSLLVFAPAAAFAQTTGPGYPTPSVSTTTDPCPPTGTVAPGICNVSVKAAQASTSSGSLPFTGANIALLVGLGLVAVAGGVVLVRIGRRADASS